MKLVVKKMIAFSVAALFSISLSANSNLPSYTAKIKLGFQNRLTCNLSDFNTSGRFVKGRTNITIDEANISWTSTCVIELPTTVKYCTVTSQQVTNPDAFISRFSGFQKKVIRAKIVSESDINPSFGRYSVTYFCFE